MTNTIENHATQSCIAVRLQRLDALQAEVLALSELDREQLEGGAVELGVDIELYCLDQHTCPANLRDDPYAVLLEFLNVYNFDFSGVAESELADFTRDQILLAAAWNFVHVARAGIQQNIKGWSPEESDEAALLYESSARQIVWCAKRQPMTRQ